MSRIIRFTSSLPFFVHTSGVELDELQILVGQTSTCDHGRAVAGARVGRRAREVGTPVAARGQHSVLRTEPEEQG